MQPSSLKILPCYPGTVWRRCEGTERANTASASMTGGGFVLNGLKEHPAHRTWRLLTTIRRNVMALIAIHPGEHLAEELRELGMRDRKSTRLNSSHLGISYAVFCLKKKKKSDYPFAVPRLHRHTTVSVRAPVVV